MGKKDDRRTRRPQPGGIDPSAFVSSGFDRKTQRKTLQLCREARDALGIALSSLDDDALLGTWVAEVLPGVDSSQLRVVVVAPAGSADNTLEALQRAAGLLRAELAQAIARKRVPLLTFEVHEEVGR
jgi:ribosome-binding factor A